MQWGSSPWARESGCSPYFKTNIIQVEGEITRDYVKLDSFVIYMCVEGALELNWNDSVYTLEMGETLLLPAVIKGVALKSDNAKIIEVYM